MCTGSSLVPTVQCTGIYVYSEPVHYWVVLLIIVYSLCSLIILDLCGSNGLGTLHDRIRWGEQFKFDLDLAEIYRTMDILLPTIKMHILRKRWVNPIMSKKSQSCHSLLIIFYLELHRVKVGSVLALSVALSVFLFLHYISLPLLHSNIET